MSHLAQSSPQVDAYLADFERLASRRAAEPSWLRNLRRQGIEHFSERGAPWIVSGRLGTRPESQMTSPNFPKQRA